MRPSLSTLTKTLGALTVALVVLVVVVVVLAVRRGDPPSADGPPATPTPSTLAQLARADVSVARAPFCDRVPAAPIEDALAGEVAGASNYGNGDTTRLGAINDVAHEYGCTWTSVTGAVASAWVFAPPVSATRAEQLAAQAARAPGCAVDVATPTRPAYGDPATATTCTTAQTVTSGHVGLFGDAWLSCTLSTPSADPATDLRARSDTWCVAVAVASSPPAS